MTSRQKLTGSKLECNQFFVFIQNLSLKIFVTYKYSIEKEFGRPPSLCHLHGSKFLPLFVGTVLEMLRSPFASLLSDPFFSDPFFHEPFDADFGVMDRPRNRLGEVNLIAFFV